MPGYGTEQSKNTVMARHKSLKAYINELEKDIKGLPKAVDESMRVAVRVSHNDTVVRIFERGQATSGAQIGQYSTKPTLVGSSSFKTKGAANKIFGSTAKRAAQEWRRVGGHNLVLLPGGYKEIRRLEGLETGFVNLRWTNNLQSDFRASIQKRKPTQYVTGTNRDDNAEKIGHLEDHFGKEIFAPTEQESDIFVTVQNRELEKRFDTI